MKTTALTALATAVLLTGTPAAASFLYNPMFLDESSEDGLRDPIEFFRPGAEMHDPAALTLLGIMNDLGQGVPRNPKKAVEYFKKGAEAGNKECYYYVAIKYLDGKDFPKDMDKARYWSLLGAKGGQAQCQYNLGLMYANADGVERDVEKAVYWLKKAADQHETRATIPLYDLSPDTCDDPDYAFNLGVYYYGGKQPGLSQDKADKKAYAYFKTAANLGHPEAFTALAHMYATGRGVAKDEKKSKALYRTAAEKNSPAGQFAMAFYYLENEERKKAFPWLEKAAQAGHADAQFLLSLCYHDGVMGKPDMDAYLKWTKRAADNGSSRAQINYASYLADHDDGTLDKTRVFDLFKKAADAGDRVGIFNVGMCYKIGYGVKSDPVKAKPWLEKACDEGYAPACRALEANH